MVGSNTRQRLVLGSLLASMLFVLGPVPPPWFLPFTLPLYFTLIVLLFVFLFFPDRSHRPVGGFQVTLLGAGLWMAIAAISNAPAYLPNFLLWESGIFLGVYAASAYGRAFDQTFLCRCFSAVVMVEAVACLVQFTAYDNGAPTVRPELFQALFPTPPQYAFRFMTGGPGLGGRLTVAPGTLWTVNGLGAWLAIAIPMLLAGARKAHLQQKSLLGGFYTGLVVVSVLLMARNLIRTASAAALVGIITYALCTRLAEPGRGLHQWRVPYVWVALVLAGVLVLSFVDAKGSGLFPGALRARFGSLLGEDAGLRLRLISAGIQGVMDRPLLGWGHGNAIQAMPPTSRIVVGLSERKERHFNREPERRLHAHDVYLTTAHEGGLPAAGLLLASIVIAVKRFLGQRGRWNVEVTALAGSVAAALFMSLFYGVMYDALWPLFMFVLGCLAGATTPREA